ncbi:tetratricopeptide repeat domain protein [Aspergillus sclerotioniger CBS 115572]|uniref:ER membrane protein complex subunit 2 n=1 Tax=Aspergillus sclerotioniger CBS 115572 TaxID=1450535 RepID=A0A317VVV1_9EURO|nr:tetratricopeptide repeat domain protein [Aspergillus sclerotioniger CBS 115572]PWY77147.1 tetratricopeptide repeat domain protein [Aspergillus sclerotioniger CBS 115572]
MNICGSPIRYEPFPLSSKLTGVRLMPNRQLRIMQTITPELQAANGSNPVTAFYFAQQAPLILRSNSRGETISHSSEHGGKDPENYSVIEQLLFSCLRAGDDKSALLCTEQLGARFGATDDKVTGLRGLYEEATADNQSTLEKCLQEYDLVLSENPMNLPIQKRRIALLRSLSRPTDAISSLINLLDAVPTDAEAWCELADLYHSQGMSSQAAFCLEEALLIVPNAWNIHAFLGELLYSGAISSDTGDCFQLLEGSIHRFCRSIELCTDYLRGFYGLVLATSLLGRKQRLDNHSQDQSSAQTRSSLTSEVLDELTNFARKRLDEIVKSRTSKLHIWKGNQSELIAAKELLDRPGNLNV